MSLETAALSVAGVPAGKLHDVLAEAGPGPAGGTAAALAATMASGLVRLVARVSPDWEEAPGIAAQAAALGDRSLALADDDHRVYARALVQLRCPRARRGARAGSPRRGGGAGADRRGPRRTSRRSPRSPPAAVPPPCAATPGRRQRWPRRRGMAAARLVHVNLATRPDGETTRADLRPAPRPPRARSRSGRHGARPVPAWSLSPGDAPPVAASPIWSAAVTRQWAYAGSDGAVDVCIVDSGVERAAPSSARSRAPSR